MSAALQSRAFNLGSDARIAGRPLKSNPYEAGAEREYWKMGWRNAEALWADGVEGRWPVRSLPLVLE